MQPVQKDLDFVRDFHEADNVSGVIHTWWLGHSGYLIKWNGHAILIDPYLSDAVTRQHFGGSHPVPRISDRVCDPLLLTGVDCVVCTSTAPDRLDPETILSLRAASPKLKLVVPAGAADDARHLLGSESPPLLQVNAGSLNEDGLFTFHGITAATPKIRVDAFGNSKELGYVIQFGAFALYTSGQTLWHNQLVKEVRRWNITLAFLPIDGDERPEWCGASLNGFAAAALAKAISASMAMSCHYGVLDYGHHPSPEEFIECCQKLGQRQRQLVIGQRLTMGPMIDPGAGKAPPSEPPSDGWGLGY